MSEHNEDIVDKFEINKRKIIENINAAKEMDINKITAIIVIDDETQNRLINWLIIDGYKVSLRKEEYNILVIEW